ncbi:MAG: S-layer homology domain-containing protein [Clostridia bacterium]
MKRLKYLLLAGALVSQLVVPSFAGTYEQDILSNMNIMTYYNGDFEENETLTRGMMAKILVTASEYKDNVVFSSISPFADVSSSHWCSPYVTTAVNNGLLRGYLDGTFKPDQDILVEEVVTAVLNLLGYTSFTGTYPTGQMSYAKSIGLLDDVNVTAGNTISRGDTAVIIYNAMNIKNSSGVLHSSTLGYNTDELTLSDVLEEEFADPYLTTSSNSFSGYKIYVDGKTATSVPINALVYVNDSSKMVYAYTSKVSGVIQDISPNIEAPTSITISGTTYSLSTMAAKMAVSFDGYAVDDYVTCVLDKNGDIGALIDFSNQTVVGIITDAGIDEDGYFVSMLTADGDMFEYTCDKDYEDYIGKLYEISSEGEFTKKSFSSIISGTFNATTMTFDGEDVSSTVKIYDVNDNGEVTKIIASRLHNVKIAKDDILYLAYNTEGKISSIILDDVTNDADDYVYMTDITVNDISSTSSGFTSGSTSYTYDLNGATVTKNVSAANNSVSEGPMRIKFDGSDIDEMKKLTAVSSSLKSVSQFNYTFENGQQHTLSTDVVVYTLVSGTPVVTNFDDVDLFNATFYYDQTQANGGAIRMIIVG